MDPPAPDPESTKTKNRPQQSCIKCRERKVKCDRAKPCRACIARGWQDECEYVRTNEDREQISHADEIESLRKELNKLKRRWADIQQSTSKMSSSSSNSLAPATTHAQAEESQRRRPRKAQRRAVDDDASLFGNQQTHGFFPDATGSYQNPGSQHTLPVDYTQNQLAGTGGLLQNNSSLTRPPDSEGSFPGQGRGYGADVGPMYTWGFSDVPASAPILYTRENSTTTPPSQQSPTSSAETAMHQLQQHPQPNFWRGKGVLMQNIYKIIRDCDDYWVPSIVEIVRSSISPEEAIRSIHRLMSSSRSPTGSSASTVSNNFSPEGWTGR